MRSTCRSSRWFPAVRAAPTSFICLACRRESTPSCSTSWVTIPSELPRLKRMIHLAAGLPVIGAIEAMPAARDALEKAPRDRRLPEELIDALSQSFWKHADTEAIRELARSRPFPEQADLSCLDRS